MKMKGKNHRRRYMYVKLRECDTTVVNMSTSVEIVQIENKTSPVSTEKRMDMSQKNVIAIIILGKNALTVTISVTKKMCDGRIKNIIKRQIRKG